MTALDRAGIIVPCADALRASVVLRSIGIPALLDPPRASPWRQISIWADELLRAHRTLQQARIPHQAFAPGSDVTIDVRCAETGDALGELRASLIELKLPIGPVSFRIGEDRRGRKAPLRIDGYMLADAADAVLADAGPRIRVYAALDAPLRWRALRDGRL